MPDEVRVYIGIRIRVGNMKPDPCIRLPIDRPFNWNVVNGDQSAAFVVFDGVEAAPGVGFGNFFNGGLNFRCHRQKPSRVVVIGNGVKFAFVRNMHLFVVTDEFVGLMVAQ